MILGIIVHDSSLRHYTGLALPSHRQRQTLSLPRSGRMQVFVYLLGFMSEQLKAYSPPFRGFVPILADDFKRADF